MLLQIGHDQSGVGERGEQFAEPMVEADRVRGRDVSGARVALSLTEDDAGALEIRVLDDEQAVWPRIAQRAINTRSA